MELPQQEAQPACEEETLGFPHCTSLLLTCWPLGPQLSGLLAAQGFVQLASKVLLAEVWPGRTLNSMKTGQIEVPREPSSVSTTGLCAEALFLPNPL